MSLRQWYRIELVNAKKRQAAPPTKEEPAAPAKPDPEEDPDPAEPDEEEDDPPAPPAKPAPEKPPAKEPEEEEDPAAAAPADTAEIYVYDEIGSSFMNDAAVTARQFIDDLAALPESVKALQLHVNSPGGDVFEALAIANALRAQRMEKGRTVDVSIDGLAASAATIVTSAGSPVRIADNAMMMVHDPWGLALGGATAMRKMADSLDRAKDSIVATYRWVSKLSPKSLSKLMSDETWMSAQEAVDNGFATKITKGMKAAASFRADVLDRLKVPAAYRAQVEALVKREEPKPADVVATVKVAVDTTEIDAAQARLAELERIQAAAAPAKPPADASQVFDACDKAGLDVAFIRALIAEKVPADQLQARVDAEKTRRTVGAARETEIRALCGARHVEDLAPELVASGMSVDAVRNHLGKVTAKLDQVHIETGLAPDHGTRPEAVIDRAAIFAELNKPRAN